MAGSLEFSGRLWRPAMALGLIVASSGIASGQQSTSHPGFIDAGTNGGFHTPSLSGYLGSQLHQDGGGQNVLNYNPGIFLGYGVGGYFAYSPPLLVVGGGGFPAFPEPTFLRPGFAANNFGPPGGGGLGLPTPPRGLVAPVPNPNALARRTNSAKAKELVEVGDRSFRGRNTKRAEEKYELAAKLDPGSPAPHVHLAQVSVTRGNYSDAADHLRDAVSVARDAGWLAAAPDVQSIFGEPADFARQLAKLETHLQVHPNDRDAWFVLGAEAFLSGRTRQAFDVFQRLTDRRPDDALAAFLDASTPRQAAAN